ELEPGLLEAEVGDVRSAPGGDEHVSEISAACLAVRRSPREPDAVAGGLRRFHRDTELEIHRAAEHASYVILQHGVRQRPDLRRQIEKRHFRAEAAESLAELETDDTGTDHGQ